MDKNIYRKSEIESSINQGLKDELYNEWMQQDERKPIAGHGGVFVNVHSLFTMLAGDAKTEKQGEANIRARFKELARLNNLTFYKSKERMLESMMQHPESRELIFNTYMEWYTVNSDAFSKTGVDMVGFEAGPSSHTCTSPSSRRHRKK